jgi:cathepsin L
MKTIFRVLIAICVIASAMCQSTVFAQKKLNVNVNAIQLQKHFAARELQATPQIKQLLVQQRKFIADNKLSFNVSVTGVSHLKLTDITGEKEINANEAMDIKKLMTNKVLSTEIIDIVKQMQLSVCTASLNSYDARNDSLVPPIRLQMCGDCWAYSATGPLECSYIRVNRITSPATINCSEKQIVDCSGGGSCSGGLAYQAFNYLKNTHVKMMTEAQYPDNGANAACPAIVPATKVELVDWGVIDPSGDINRIAPVDKIKEAICTYGPIAVSMNATPLFQNFAGGGVYYETPSDYANPVSNHAVMLVGWDDAKQAWLLRNSWDVTWGDDGYCWIKYNTNNIGKRAAWVVAKKVPLTFKPKKIDINILKRYLVQ